MSPWRQGVRVTGAMWVVAGLVVAGCTTFKDVPNDGESDNGADTPDGGADISDDGELPDGADGGLDVLADVADTGGSDVGSDISDSDVAVPDGGDVEEDADAAELDADVFVPDVDTAGGCVVPTSGMEIGADVTLCAGSFPVDDSDDDGAVKIVAAGVTVTCLGTRLNGPGGGASATGIGFAVGALDGVALVGCGATGFRYGLWATGSTNLSVDGGNYRGNFNDPNAPQTGDTLQGGGIRLEAVTGAEVTGAELGNNFNGIELRGCLNITVEGVDTSPTSNAGALVLDTRSSKLLDSTFSNAARGPIAPGGEGWVGADTFGAAGVWVDAGSTLNTIEGNTIEDSGAGIAVRDTLVPGTCPTRNTIRANVVSGSARAGVELRCDDNDVDTNTLSDNQFGVLLQGADGLDVKSNTISGSVEDGISAQGNTARHLLISSNVISGSGRAGILVAGKAYPAGSELTDGAGQLFNASHVVVEANQLENNGTTDIFLAWLRGLVLISNCGVAGGLPNVAAGPQAGDVFPIGECVPVELLERPKAVLGPVTATVGEATTFDATGSTNPIVEPLAYYWLMQPNVGAWGSPDLPSVPFNGMGQASFELTLNSPGQFEANVIVHNGKGADLATRSFVVVPQGKDWAEANVADWVADCTGVCTPSVEVDTDKVLVGASSMRIDTNAELAFWTGIQAPAGEPFNLVGGAVSFFIRVKNPNSGGWQGQFPRLELVDADGNNRFISPGANLLTDAEGQWRYVTIPVAGSPPQWTVADGGVKLAQISRVHIYTDTFGTLPYTLWIDGLTLTAP